MAVAGWLVPVMFPDLATSVPAGRGGGRVGARLWVHRGRRPVKGRGGNQQYGWMPGGGGGVVLERKKTLCASPP